MALDPAKPLQQAKLSPGEILFEAGQAPRMLCLLHQGEVTAYSRVSGVQKRLYVLGGNSSPGFGPLLTGATHPVTLIVTKESAVSAFPVKGNFTQLILGKLNVGMLAARSLLQETIQTYNVIKKYAAFLSMLQKCNDNLAIAYFKASPGAFEQTMAGGEAYDPVMPAAKFTVGEFRQNGGEIPDRISPEWLQGDYSNLLRKNYEFDSGFDLNEFNFLKRILTLPMDIQGNVFKTDLGILQGLAFKFAKILENNVQEMHQLQDSVDESMEMLTSGEYCYVEKFQLLADTLDSGFTNVPLPEFLAILKFINSATTSFLKNYQGLYAVPFNDVSPSLEKVKEFITNQEAENPEVDTAGPAASGTTAGIDMDAVKKELSGAPGKIMNFVGMPADEGKKMLTELQALRGLQNPMDSGGDPRKMRRGITKIYWEVFEKAFFKFQESNGNVPKTVRLMLEYGFFDETFLNDEHLIALYTLEDTTRARSDYKILRGMDWLPLVASKDELCSVDEMGLSFFDKVKQENKDKGWKRETDVPDEYDNFNIRIRYELQNFMQTVVRLTTGSPTTAFPILTKYQIVTDLEKSFVTLEKLSEAIERVLSVDYSAFHREIIVNDEEQNILKEFVQRQVIPYFIIVPSIGTKVMMWQDISGRNKASLGRIAVPTFATADLFTLLLDAVGAFRWELTKTIQGPDWNNVSQPSITADYTDYVQFFKKNRDLSPEVKEKLASEFKRFRSDRDRFINDYINWIKYESEGVLKLNKVARNILYRHVPFAKSIRDNLASQPAYADIQNRFKNIRMKKLKELEVRYRKYGEVLPEILQSNIDFHKV